MKIALLSAAVNGDNSGDAIIETAVRRLLKDDSYKRFPLTVALSDEQIAEINTFDKLLICGTNLYQHVFACNLTEDVVKKIRIPIIPFGIGSSAPIGEVPKMNEEGVRAVRAIHKTCKVSSVRDLASYKFLKSIGVNNVRLTGCPVLFHGLGCPDFTLEGEDYTLTPRARLLHIEDVWDRRQNETLEKLASYYRPTLVLQSPYDIPVSQKLADKYGLKIEMDKDWQADRYIELAKSQYLNMGFRLHFAMLSISYGKPAFLVSHDSRASEFCELIKIPLIDIKDYHDNSLVLQIDTKCFDASTVQKRWDELSLEMSAFTKECELESNITLTSRSRPVPQKKQAVPKPRILLLMDKRGWAFDHSAQSIASVLKNDFDFDFAYVAEKPQLDPKKYDLMYVFFWGETYYKQFGFKKEQIIKELSSHRWEDNPEYGPCTPSELVDKYLNDSGSIICTSLRLVNTINKIHSHVYHTPNGFDAEKFFKKEDHTGQLTFGWAGNINDGVKGFKEFVIPAAGDQFKILSAPGNLTHKQMNDFYNKLDVFVVSSRNEGEPLTLIESMAAGCFPVCVNVGIVPELIIDGDNGIILKDRSVEEFRRAFDWCAKNIDHVRRKGKENAELMIREREWHVTASFFKYVFNDAYRRLKQPRFRNDDVSFDTDLTHFKQFCNIFKKYDITQVHGVTLRGNTNTLFEFENEPVEYEGHPNISRLDYDTVIRLSAGKDFTTRKDLVDFLNKGNDEVAVHGYYHTDYSKMSEEQQRNDMSKALSTLRQLFPAKDIRYFIPPFNRTNEATFKVAGDLGLKVLGTEGKHLEAELNNLQLENSIWYRYHHHRFYPDSKFSYYKLDLTLLDESLGKNLPVIPHKWNLVKIPTKKIRKPSLSQRVKNKLIRILK